MRGSATRNRMTKPDMIPDVFARTYTRPASVIRFGIAGLLAFAFASLPQQACSQQGRVARVGVVLPGGPYQGAVDGLRDGLRELGLEEGKHVVLQTRDARGDLAQAEKAASGLEAEQVDLIVAITTSVTLAVRKGTKRVPIVFYGGTDPVQAGLVESFRRPGGRLTGIHRQSTDLTAKRLEILKEMIPRARRVVTFYRPDSLSAQQSIKIARESAQRLHLDLVERPVASVEELATGLKALQRGEVDAYFAISDAMVTSQTALITSIAQAKRLPTMLQETGSVAQGALAGYGESYYALGQLSARPVFRVLRGAKPSELPVEQVTKLHFVINLKTAQALGIVIPPSVLARADEVLQ